MTGKIPISLNSCFISLNGVKVCHFTVLRSFLEITIFRNYTLYRTFLYVKILLLPLQFMIFGNFWFFNLTLSSYWFWLRFRVDKYQSGAFSPNPNVVIYLHEKITFVYVWTYVCMCVRVSVCLCVCVCVLWTGLCVLNYGFVTGNS